MIGKDATNWRTLLCSTIRAMPVWVSTVARVSLYVPVKSRVVTKALLMLKTKRKKIRWAKWRNPETTPYACDWAVKMQPHETGGESAICVM